MRLTLWFVTALACTSCGPAAEGDGAGDSCTGTGDCGADEICRDAVCQKCVELFGEPSDPCMPACGNSIGVGQPCTEGGGECNSNDIHAKFCTVDQVDDPGLIMCTGPCLADDDCAEDTVCQGDPADPDSPKGCVPASCATE